MKNKKMRTTKGQMGQLGLLIIILVSAIIIFFFLTKFVNKTNYDQIINTCRFSVLAQTATEISPGISGSKSPLDLDCEKRYINFYNTKVDLGTTPETMKPTKVVYEGHKVTKFTKLNEDVVNQAIAEELRICKFEFGDGKVEIFANDEKFWTNENVCYVCAEINFEQEVQGPKYNSLVQYTKENSFSDTKQSYYDYLTEKTYAGNEMWGQPLYDPSTWTKIFTNADGSYANLEIDTSKKYLVFIEKRKPGKVELLNWGRPEWVTILPADEINKYCDVQGN